MLIKARNYLIAGIVLFVIAAALTDGSKFFSGGDNKKESDDEARLTLEIEAYVPRERAESYSMIAVSAQLGSGGNLNRASTQVWDNGKHPGRLWQHHFRAKRGEKLSANLASMSGPVLDLGCYFYQEGIPSRGQLEPNVDGWGDITNNPDVPTGPVLKASCAATVK